jgi:hypothetical protein
VRLISRDARLSGYFFHRLSLRDGGETGTFLSNQTFPRATPKACVCSLATLKKNEQLTRTLLLRRRLVGKLWLANFRCHDYYTLPPPGSLLAQLNSGGGQLSIGAFQV